MNKVIIMIFLYLISIPVKINSQVTQEWVATYSGTGSGYNFPKKSAIDKFGNFIIAGNSSNTGGYDYVVLKYSPSGVLIWSRRYNGIVNGYDYLSGMVLDDSGNIYVTGSSDEGMLYGGVNWLTIKYNSDGIMQWKRSLNWKANGTDESFGMTIDKNSNIYVIGYGKTISVYRQMITIKYDSNGYLLWTKVYRSNPDTHDWGYSVVTDDSLNVYSSGYGIIPTGNEIVNIKYDSNGNEKWVNKFPTHDGDWLRPTYSSINEFSNLIVVGYNYTSTSYYDFVTLKYSSDGKLLWNRLFDRGDDDYANSLFLDNESNILIGGITVDSNFKDFLVVKYSTDGDLQFMKIFNGGASLQDEASSIISDTMRNIYVTGFTQSILNYFDYLTIKLSPVGDTIWSKIYRTNYDNYARCLNLDNDGSVYVSGSGGTPGGNSQMASIKYSQLTGMIINSNPDSVRYQLSNYPNPFNVNTQISFQIPENSFITLIVNDITGKKIETLINEFQNRGNYKVNFKGESYSSGVYFYSLICKGQIVKTRRMLIIK